MFQIKIINSSEWESTYQIYVLSYMKVNPILLRLTLTFMWEAKYINKIYDKFSFLHSAVKPPNVHHCGVQKAHFLTLHSATKVILAFHI